MDSLILRSPWPDHGHLVITRCPWPDRQTRSQMTTTALSWRVSLRAGNAVNVLMKDVWTWHEHVIRWHAAHGLLYTINLGLHVQPLSVIKRRGESMLVFTETDFSRRCVIRHIGNLQTWHHDAHFVIATNISWGHCPLSQSCGHVPLLPPPFPRLCILVNRFTTTMNKPEQWKTTCDHPVKTFRRIYHTQSC